MAEISAPTPNLAWSPPGPVSERFMLSPLPWRGALVLNGPIGSGKTTTCLMRGVRLASQQRPSPRARRLVPKTDAPPPPGYPRPGTLLPVSFFKMIAVRDTYRQLWKTTLPSWWKRIPRDFGTFTGAENAPCSHHFEIVLPDRIIDFGSDFIAIGENAVEDVMRGYEFTLAYLNDFDLLAREVLAYALGRAGRYPDIADGGPTNCGALADCNAPVFESWLYQGSEIDEATGRAKPGIFTMTPAERAAAGVGLFIQPGGRDPGAENLENLPEGYYTPRAEQSDDYVARMIDNKSGYSSAGKPVHAAFKATLHVAAKDLDPLPGVPLIIGLDPHTYPSAVFIQRLPNGQRRVVDELQAEQNTGADRFGEMVAQRLHDKFPFLRPGSIRGMADPSAAYGADKAAGEHDWIEIVAARTGIRVEGAPTNSPEMRRAAVRVLLRKVERGEPMLLISPHCTVTCAGLAAGFRFRKLNVPGATRYSDEVEKNHFADMVEALEYGCMSDGAELDILERKTEDVARQRRLQAQSGPQDWDVFGERG